MDIKMGDYLPGSTVSTVCRCCLAEGCYKDISTEYFWMGKREVYSEMLKETLNLSIAFSKSGTPNCNSRLICEACISKLRDATDFKKQVQQCEKMFMQHLDPGRLVEIEVIPASSKESVKVECVKVENEASDDDFDQPALDDDDDYDDMDDQPLTSLAKTKPAMKKETDILDIMSNRQVTVKRKIPETETRPSKRKKDVKPSASKQPVAKVKKSKAFDYARKNGEILIKFTTAYPFRLPKEKMMCAYCGDDIPTPCELKNHMDQYHKRIDPGMTDKTGYFKNIKVDITDLRCRLCDNAFDTLDIIAKHLIEVHGKKINLKHEIELQPFKFSGSTLACAVCDKRFYTLRTLSVHTLTHFARFSCKLCDKSYTTLNALSFHTTFNHDLKGKFCCKRCKMVFPSNDAKNEHLEATPSCRLYVCSVCNERYVTFRARNNHLAKVHGVERKVSVCVDCGMKFNTKRLYRTHFTLEHSTDYYECSVCKKKFEMKKELDNHQVVHTKEKTFPCSFCSRIFGRKRYLSQHIDILHSEFKRFECKPCYKKFNHKRSFKGHIRVYHPEKYDFENDRPFEDH